ncbi:hypothetical protein ACIBEJ_35925 [Nonomuraea sp. NPDC050790]
MSTRKEVRSMGAYVDAGAAAGGFWLARASSSGLSLTQIGDVL